MSATVHRLRALWRHGGWSMAAFALTAGALAAWSMQHYLSSRIADIEARHRTPTVMRLVVAQRVAAGDVADDDTVAVAPIPTQWAASDGLAPEDYGQWAGALFVTDLSPGEQVTTSHLRNPQPRSLASSLTAGRRAVTVVLDDISAQARVLSAGDCIDMYITLDRAGSPATHLLLSGVRVLAVGGQGDSGEPLDLEGAGTLTLDVSPAEAARLVAARQRGALSAVLRDGAVGAGHNALVRLTHDVQITLGLVAPPKVRARRLIPVLYGSDLSSRGASEVPGDADAQGASW